MGINTGTWLLEQADCKWFAMWMQPQGDRQESL